MFCSKCGAEINDKAVICVKCGCAVSDNCVNNSLDKNWLVTLLLCLFLGGIGAHRFYTGHIAIGIIQLLTAGGCGIWTLIDLILILCGEYKAADGSPLHR